MTLKTIVSFLIITLLLAACASPTATLPVVTESPTTPTTQSKPPTYPPPASGTAAPTTSTYPEPGAPGTGTPKIPPSGYEPQPGDESLKRDEANVDLANSHLLVYATEPVQVKATLNGDMPDPCHVLRVIVTPPDPNNTIKVEVYSLVDPSTACVTKIQPFAASIPLGSYTDGEYTVTVNGEELGQFRAAIAPQPGDDKLTRGDATVDMTASKLTFSGTQPKEVSANLEGTLSDPCHQLRIALTADTAKGRINLEVYSVFDSKSACITVIQPFQVIYPLGSFSEGHYSVYVNGELLGEFDG